MPEFMTTDRLIAIGIAMYVIKELFSLVKSILNTKVKPATQTVGPDEGELLYRQNMMTQHERMTESLNATLAISKSTNDKCGNMEKNIIILKERTEK